MVKNGNYAKEVQRLEQEAKKRAEAEAEEARRRAAQMQDAQKRVELASTADESIKSAKAQQVIADADKVEAEAAARKAQAEAEMAEARAREEKAKITQSDITGEKWEVRNKNALRIFDGSWKWLKRIALMVAIYYVGKGACTAIRRDSKPNPDGTMPNPLEQVGEATGRAVTAVPKAVNTVADTTEKAVDRFDESFTRPKKLSTFLDRIDGFGSFKTGIAAGRWTNENPQMPLTGEDAAALREARRQFKAEHGRPMTEKEVIATGRQLFKWGPTAGMGKEGGR